MRDGVGGGEQVECSNTRSHQRLVGVAKSRVGNQQTFFFPCPGGEFPRSELLQELTGACWRFSNGRCRADCWFAFFPSLLPFYFGISIEDSISATQNPLSTAAPTPPAPDTLA